MTIDRFGERYIESGVQLIVQRVDSEGLLLYQGVYNFVGVPGTTPTSLNTYVNAGVQLHNMATPTGMMRSSMVSPAMEGAILGFNSNIFNPAKTISDQYMTGRMGTAVGQKFSMDQNIRRQVVGTCTGSVPTMTTAANQSGNSILTTGWTANAAVLNAGDIISIANVNGVNPLSWISYGLRRTFVVTQNVVAAGDGTATIYISPAIDADPNSPFQTVDSLPAANAVIYVYEQATGAAMNAISGVQSAQGLVFHRDAFTLACARLELPGGMDWSEEVTNPKIGLSMRLTRGFDIRTNQRITRINMFGGWALLRPEMACRVCAG